MTDAILSRGGTSVTVPILATGGSLAIARDVGKPTAGFPKVGREDPRSQDYQNAGVQWTIVGLLRGSSAYDDAQTLAEDLIKPQTDGTALSLDLSALPSHSTYDVAPANDRALALTYRPGETDMVAVGLSLTAVGETIPGSTQSASANLSPDAGTGVKIERDGTSVTLTSGLTITRQVGRPNAKIQARNATLPTVIDQNKPASDVFEISAARLTESEATTLAEDIVRDRLGTDTLTLHFLSNLASLDAYRVFPEGSQAVRYSFQAGATDYVNMPTLKLRVVDNT